MASSADRPKIRPFLYLGLFIFIWIGLPVSWKLFLKSGFDEFQAPLWETASRVGDLSHFWGHMADSKTTLIEKNRALSRIQADQKLQTGRNLELHEEIARLRGLITHLDSLEKQINLDPKMSFTPLLARVSKRTLNGWWQGFTVRRGKNAGLRTGLGVLHQGGVLGRIRNVGNRSANIELISSPGFRVVAHFDGDDRPVTFQGDGIALGGTPRGIVTDVPHDLIASEQAPLILKSSSLSGNYPNGLKIGKVHLLEGGEDGLFKRGQVLLDPQLGHITEVTVLLPNLPQE